MKLILIGLFFLTGCMDSTPTPKVAEPAKASEVKTATEVKEEDCDDKAKQPIEIKEESISLSGNTGCTLEE